ncbi:hypothetical protein X777_07810 [Ooceraea biroi]|uniref:Uncharacterized protein n=1 Tax=Ooceraea biroi TaxID=2015173 RepID=A0A026WZL7_OOCBI|nr:hypothetical protein X777_07810 [Ooceraea biroi]
MNHPYSPFISEIGHFGEKCFRQKLYGFEGDIRWYHWFDLEELLDGHMKYFSSYEAPKHAIQEQQDGCPSHTSRVARAVINNMFPNKWIGKYGPIDFPPRLPDLTVLDYY